MSNIKKNVLYSIIHQFIIVLTPLILSPYIARVLGAEGVGVYTYSFTIVQYFGMFILLGLANYGNRAISRAKVDKEKLNSEFISIYALQLMLGIIITLLYLGYALFFAEYRMYALIQMIYIIAMAIDVSWFLYGMEEFKVIAVRSTLIKVLTCILCIICIRDLGDLYKYILFMSLSYMASALACWPTVIRNIEYKKVGFKNIIRHIKPNLTLFVPVIAISIYSSMDIIMLGMLKSKIEVGYYTNTNSIVRIPLAFITGFGTVMLPRVSNMLVSGDDSEVENFLKKSLIYVIGTASAISFGTMSIVNIFIPWYLGPGYERCIVLAYFMLPCQVILAIANVIRTQYIIPYGKDNVYIISVFIGAIVNFIINLILMKNYGAVGAAIATVIAETAVCAYQFYIVQKESDILISLKYSIPFLLLGMLMLIVNTKIVTNVTISIGNIVSKTMLGAVIYILGSMLYYKVVLERKV